jgi:hypothetical protein
MKHKIRHVHFIGGVHARVATPRSGRQAADAGSSGEQA